VRRFLSHSSAFIIWRLLHSSSCFCCWKKLTNKIPQFNTQKRRRVYKEYKACKNILTLFTCILFWCQKQWDNDHKQVNKDMEEGGYVTAISSCFAEYNQSQISIYILNFTMS
jgi:hypothetical protein